jgi:hypothetical protein
MHPFAALGTHYSGGGIYQRTFGELVIVDKHSRPVRCMWIFELL